MKEKSSWKRKRYRLNVIDIGWVTRTGWVKGQYAIGRRNIYSPPKFSGAFVVTHIPSGYAAGSFNTRLECERWVEILSKNSYLKKVKIPKGVSFVLPKRIVSSLSKKYLAAGGIGVQG